jgi:hypothetical protein
MIGAALEDLDLTAMLAALREQEALGHTATSDAEIRLCSFADKLATRAAELADVLREGDRQNLAVAYRRGARLAAFALAAMRRIRIEQAKGAPIT